ncbi:hypothetical protein WOLCODRAFT_159880 [Wolfiporia cocos MD-104 SS10]|uniref:Uncharacterized protein n=1 Tax=Wolfiporia cocos (strain MD-104) TaxID=742152 RepID=A0A2H3J947_WOLCO|nr:hypothetical protein WOLCODRAFT_159880 [Wolfiporia cocos MD-104 SS10]
MSSLSPPPTSDVTSTEPRCSTPIAIGQRVRFDVECVLIPDPVPVSRRPKLVTRSYNVPLWRKRGQEPSTVSDSELDPREDEHVVFKVSVPSLSIRARSPVRTPEALRTPLIPCLVQHDPSSFPRPMRRQVSLPPPAPPHRADVTTVPLRACCPNCVAGTEYALRVGAHWQERFTRGARRRRGSSADSREPARAPLARAVPGFDAVVAVDEVDKRCKTRDTGADGVLLPSLARHGSLSRGTTARAGPSTEVFSSDDELSPSPSPVTDDAMHSATPPSSLPPPTPPVLEVLPGLKRHKSVTEVREPTCAQHVESHIAAHSTPDLLAHTPLISLLMPIRRAGPVSSLPAAPPYIAPEVYAHARPATESEGARTRRRPTLHLPGPGSFFKVSAEILKGVSLSGGTPLSV